ncbi:PhoH Phosphate starvation-inducible protein PhoH, predicted ATPase [uncultured Caudovirales phage]|uniref:PhoH Phosphate starvation-inducible protein PhoH, predicted ATPase n=1 Tax=uncultured Caudovirales phage TaxID=2100421 RepID=A0A6J7WT01_9CAUD|nr:PhoH Phosphate starvation-inducible protein PhoH, predicted ATPase [uncultured Caudovirales phage]
MDKLTRAERRELKNHKRQESQQQKNNLKLKEIVPKTLNQDKMFKEFFNNKNLLVHGLPGTGKSFLSLYLALNELEQFKEHRNVTIIRSVVPSRDMGFLPGSIKEKSKAYESPYIGICSELYGRADAYEILKQKGQLNFETSSFLRGMTIDNSIIIVDECQNMTYHELCTIITRMGKNSKVIFCGDYRQSDFKYDDEKVGVFHFMKIISSMKRHFSTIEMEIDDIVRSGLVKEFIIRKQNYENPKVVVVPNDAARMASEQKVFH